jgi:hypothetical protein
MVLILILIFIPFLKKKFRKRNLHIISKVVSVSACPAAVIIHKPFWRICC